MRVLAIDPGTTESAYVIWDGERILEKGKRGNEEMRIAIDCLVQTTENLNHVAIEMVASYGMPVGKEVFETVLFIGRFYEIAEQAGADVQLIYRKDVKMHHCNSMKAKDGNIRQALIDKYGEPGTKKAPGITHGVSSDIWSALAIATMITEKQNQLTAEVDKW